jgi:hypothetical protein
MAVNPAAWPRRQSRGIGHPYWRRGAPCHCAGRALEMTSRGWGIADRIALASSTAMLPWAMIHSIALPTPIGERPPPTFLHDTQEECHGPKDSSPRTKPHTHISRTAHKAESILPPVCQPPHLLPPRAPQLFHRPSYIAHLTLPILLAMRAASPTFLLSRHLSPHRTPPPSTPSAHHPPSKSPTIPSNLVTPRKIF